MNDDLRDSLDMLRRDGEWAGTVSHGDQLNAKTIDKVGALSTSELGDLYDHIYQIVDRAQMTEEPRAMLTASILAFGLRTIVSELARRAVKGDQ